MENGKCWCKNTKDEISGNICAYEFTCRTNDYKFLPYFLSKGYECCCNKEFCDCKEKREMVIL